MRYISITVMTSAIIIHEPVGLALPHRCIQPLLGQKLTMRAALAHLAISQYQNFISIDNRRKPVCNDQRCPAS
jgi:hypothetical protein